ncbi:MFS transporter [Allofournierella sp.]|uniref:MFS transporter n=1 Tax=Allofournierella sp. TaxID=1940256 RepID=UPI003AB30F64
MKKLFGQYAGLRREMYIIFFGRVVTNMGALIWPMLTLILKSKMGLSASDSANLLLLLGVLQLPCTMIGGKLADRFSKRSIIIVCDLVTVGCYLACSMLPISPLFVALFFVAGIFAQMEWPSYDALVADMSSSADRERAYSLNYLGANLGLVLAPTLGGLLFAQHLNLAFLINAVSTFSSTVLIFFFIRNTRPTQDASPVSRYEAGQQGSTWQVLRRSKVLWLFLLCSAVGEAVYSQFNFLLPLNMEQLYGQQGAVWFGMLTSVNATVVILCTPLLTARFCRLCDTSKLLAGEALIALGFAFYIFVQGFIPLYFAAMVVFTLGEIFITLGRQPYLTRRIPASHRGRLTSITLVGGMLCQGLALKVVGLLADRASPPLVWALVVAVAAAVAAGYALLRRADRRAFPLLYK